MTRGASSANLRLLPQGRVPDFDSPLMTASNQKPLSTGAKFPKALAAAGLAAVLVGCGGGSSDSTMGDSQPLTLPTTGLPTAFLPAPGTLSIPAGESRISGGVMFSCADGGPPCEVVIGSDGVATSTGGDVTASLTTAAQHTINQNTANADRDAQRSSAAAAVSVATNAVIDISNSSTDADLESAQEAIDAATANIQSATALTQGDQTVLLEQVDQQQRLLNSKKEARMAYIEEEKQDMMEDENRAARTQQRQAADMAISDAFMEVDKINNDSTNADLESAQQAIDKAKETIEMATHLPEDERTRRLALVDDYQESFNDKREMAMDAMEKKEEDMKMATTKAAMDLYGALDGPTTSSNLTALDNTDNHTDPIEFTNEGKLTLRISENAAGDENFSAEKEELSLMPEVDVSSAALDGWTGAKYGLTEMNSKIEYEAVVYTNQGEPEKEAFLTWATAGSRFTTSDAKPLTSLGLTTYIEIDGTDDDHLKYIESPIFNHSGEKTHTLKNNIADGSFNGVSGKYRCDSNCTSDGNGSPMPASLGGTWTFYPSTDGMIDVPDENYLIYGWWVRKDMDGMPTAASAFYNTVGTVSADAVLWSNDREGTAITGGATYTGKAVGKFAIHDPFNAELNNSGHFTANAELKADFEEGNTVTGTIDNFRLNDESANPNWSVSLNESTWAGDGGVEGKSTTWSINGIESEESGLWDAQMFDHTPDDNIKLPTTAIGKFYSEIDSRYRMVGAFATEIEEN